MDILGYKDLVTSSQAANRQQEMLQRLHRALAASRKWLAPNETRLSNRLTKDRFALKAFTDNIVIGWPIRDDAESEFGDAFFRLGDFQLQMVLEGFFIRGALSVGDAYVDEIAVFGEALIEAYVGESRLARDPRIVLTQSAVEVARHHLTYYGNGGADAPHVRHLLKDADGQWFLNYLEAVLYAEHESGPFYDQLLQHKKVTEEKLEEHSRNPALWSKYAWVAGYHNYFCDLHTNWFKEEHRVDADLYEAKPSLIVDMDG